MSLEQLPHELQLNIFRYLVNDYSSLCALVIVSRDLHDCAAEILKPCRILDLSDGVTDNIESVLGNLYSLATDVTAAVPQVGFRSTGSGLGNDIVRHASRYKTLKVSLRNPFGMSFEEAHISDTDMSKFELMMKMLAENSRYNNKAWKTSFSAGDMGASLRLILHTMRHITTLELGGNMNYLPRKMENMRHTLRTLKLVGITNRPLPPHCCRLANGSDLIALEFSAMCITSPSLTGFYMNFSITSLRFTQCYVSTNALTRVIKACKELVTFEYSLSASHWVVKHAHPCHQYHMGQLLSDLSSHGNTLKNLTITDPDGAVRLHCNHVGSLAEFSVLEALAVNYEHLEPHRYFCRSKQPDSDGVYDHVNAVDTMWRFPPSVQTLRLHRCDEVSVINTLFKAVDYMEDIDFLPSLHTLEVMYVQSLPGDLARSARQQRQEELDLYTKFKTHGVEIKFKRP